MSVYNYGWITLTIINIYHYSSLMVTSIRASIFPFAAGIISIITIWGSYFIARSKSPPDVDRFPKTDITHCGIKPPEYLLFRIGLLSILPVFSICWYMTKNYLQIMYFNIIGQYNTKIQNLGLIGTIASGFLAVSTATISDGSDMLWTWHSIGATGFFIIALYNCFSISSSYKKLWAASPGFCPRFSYLYKANIRIVSVVLLGVQCLCWAKILDVGELIEWLATFYIMGIFFTLGLDFGKMNLAFRKK